MVNSGQSAYNFQPPMARQNSWDISGTIAAVAASITLSEASSGGPGSVGGDAQQNQKDAQDQQKWENGG